MRHTRRTRTGHMSVDTLTVGGLSTKVTFGEMTKMNLGGCSVVDGIMGMGLSNKDGQNAFEDMVDVSCRYECAYSICVCVVFVIHVHSFWSSTVAFSPRIFVCVCVCYLCRSCPDERVAYILKGLAIVL